MFDFGIGSFELMMLAIVAIIVVGPKDLPKLLRTIGQFTTKIRGLAREFQGYLDEAARDTGLDDVKKDISKATNFDLNETFENVTGGDADKSEPDIDPLEASNKAAKAEAAKVRARDAAAEAKSKPAKKSAKKPAKAKAKAKA